MVTTLILQRISIDPFAIGRLFSIVVALFVSNKTTEAFFFYFYLFSVCL